MRPVSLLSMIYLCLIISELISTKLLTYAMKTYSEHANMMTRVCSIVVPVSQDETSTDQQTSRPAAPCSGLDQSARLIC
jgi:hypothetical protein